MFGARAARAALDEPALSELAIADSRAAGPLTSSPLHAAPSPASRERLWRYAGLVRDGDGLRQLLDDPHPLVRLIATAALARTESRGAHWRTDFPAMDPALEERHVTLVRGQKSVFEHWK